jgi:hypothetical protein
MPWHDWMPSGPAWWPRSAWPHLPARRRPRAHSRPASPPAHWATEAAANVTSACWMPPLVSSEAPALSLAGFDSAPTAPEVAGPWCRQLPRPRHVALLGPTGSNGDGRDKLNLYAHGVHIARCAGGQMPRSMVGLLAAVGAAMSALAGIVHGDFVPVVIAHAAVATGLAAYLALSGNKKKSCDIPHGAVYIPRGMSHESVAPRPPDRCFTLPRPGCGSPTARSSGAFTCSRRGAGRARPILFGQSRRPILGSGNPGGQPWCPKAPPGRTWCAGVQGSLSPNVARRNRCRGDWGHDNASHSRRMGP